MSHMIAGIDVHKKMLAVVIADASSEEGVVFQRQKFHATPGQLRLLGEWLEANAVQEVVMESTAQYWRPVWQALEGKFHLELAQAQSNRGPRGRKSDFRDVERLWRRYCAEELILSYVPDPEQRLGRTLSRTRPSWLLWLPRTCGPARRSCAMRCRRSVRWMHGIGPCSNSFWINWS